VGAAVTVHDVAAHVQTYKRGRVVKRADERSRQKLKHHRLKPVVSD
jgi:hypothetical protein